jgi:hypothetical protein
LDDVVPIQGEYTVECDGPIGGALLVGSESGNEMLCVGFVGVFDSQIVEYQRESDGFGLMLPKAWCVFGGYVSIRFQMYREFLVR